MFSTYIAKYIKVKSGYMGQLVEWPEVVTEGKTLEECRAMLQDALHEMILAYRRQKKRDSRGRRAAGADSCSDLDVRQAPGSHPLPRRKRVLSFSRRQEPFHLYERQKDDPREKA